MGYSLGFQAKLYYDAADSWDSPDWVELPNVMDCKLNQKFDKEDITTRGDGGVKTFAASLEDVNVTFDAINDPSDTGLAALRAKYAARGMVHVMALDGPLDQSGVWGREFWAQLFDNSRDEGLGSGQKISIEVAPTRAPAVDEAMRWVEVA